MDRQTTLRVVSDVLAGEAGIIAAIAFGSVVRGSARPDSDLDLAVLYRDDIAKNAFESDLIRFLGTLSSAAGRVVHLVDLAKADSALRRSIFATGERLFDHSTGRLHALVHRSALEYADWAYARSIIDAGHRRHLELSRG